MMEFGNLRISGASLPEFCDSYNEVISSLPRETAKVLASIRKNYFSAFGVEGWYQRMNNRSVAQIVAEYQPGDEHPIASGELDGVRWALYDPPKKDPDKHQ